MNCCVNCFSSNYVKNIINVNNNGVIGNCVFCDSKGVPVYNPEELGLIFQNIFDLYIVDNDKGDFIENQVVVDFKEKIFSTNPNLKIKELLLSIISLDIDSYQVFFDNKVRLAIRSNSQNLVEPLQNLWDLFSNEIKTTNRFHIQNTLDLSKLEILIKRYSKRIKKGKIFYRARISDVNGFEKEMMYNPPANKARSGRANPSGISYLYLADSIKTTLYEVRASLFDYVTVGKFQLLEDIEIINLRGDAYDPILLVDNQEESLEDFLIHEDFIEKLESELSKPKRRSDTELDYIPTQYLSEFIKSIGFNGVEYQSSLYSLGHNLAVFSTEKFKCIDVNVYEIKKLTLDFE